MKEARVKPVTSLKRIFKVFFSTNFIRAVSRTTKMMQRQYLMTRNGMREF